MEPEHNNERPAERASEKTYAGMTRRTLCLGVGGAAVMLGLGGLTFVGSTPLVRPPGGQDEEHLMSACIRCEKCFEICPHDIIPVSYTHLDVYKRQPAARRATGCPAIPSARTAAPSQRWSATREYPSSCTAG